MSISDQARSSVFCRACGAALPVPEHARAVLCPGCKVLTEIPPAAPAKPREPDVEEPLIVDETPAAGLGLRPALSEGRRRSSSDSTAIWVVVGLVGVTTGIYAIYLANRPAPATPEPRPAVVERPAAPTTPARPLRRSRPVAKAPVGKSEAVAAPAPVVERVDVEEPAGKAAMAGRASDDPVKEFESEKAFDNPTHRDSRGRPGLSTFNNPVHGRLSSFENPPSGYVSRRAPQPPPDRPNVPDPSFRNPAPGGPPR
jgi:hypothetical protein